MPLGHLTNHQAKEGYPVGHLQCAVVLEVEFELPVAAFVVEAEHAEVAVLQRGDEVVQEFRGIQRRFSVVSGGRVQAAAAGERCQIAAARLSWVEDEDLGVYHP